MTLEEAEKIAIEYMKKRPKVKNVKVDAVLEGDEGKKIVRGILERVNEEYAPWTSWQVTVSKDGKVLEWKYMEG